MGLWATAESMARQTPDTRNRYVDFLRAASIAVVILGHWLIATAWVDDGDLVLGHLIKDQPQLQWLTWIFQVMPVFFIVGGYSHAVSLESAARKAQSYRLWLAGRLSRLVTPLFLLIVAWAIIAFVLTAVATPGATIQYLSQAALIPTWFLAIYIMVAILAPLAYRFWRRAGWLSIGLFAGLAVATDVAFFAGAGFVGWGNYFWVWLAVHQLGFAWRDGRIPARGPLAVIGVAGFLVLAAMIFLGPYPMAMVGSPDEGLSNTLPPKATLLALAAGQFGLLLSIESPMQRRLEGLKIWTATVLVNSMIMTVYLWHVTVMLAVGSTLYLGAGFGFGIEPGSAAWWWSRPLWLALLLAVLVPFALLLSPVERLPAPDASRTPGAPVQVAGAALFCLGIALLALFGFGDTPADWLDLTAVALVVAGIAISGQGPRLRPV
jgi:peptidoglycan/LPS O-acetylase OafA/YrhL